jgi:hypothetical protein
MTLMPFVFHGCLAVRELVGPEAWDARALLEGIGQVSDEMLFTHTAGTMLRRTVQGDAWPNDFALWAATELGELRRSPSGWPWSTSSTPARSMRCAPTLVAVFEDHLHRARWRRPADPGPRALRLPAERTSCPCRSASPPHTLREFRDGHGVVDASALFYHVVEVALPARA